MRYLSLFSGIEAASIAWEEPLGWTPVAFSEIEPMPCALLKYYWPHVPNLGDITKITEEQIKNLGHIDIVVGGVPCQDWSIAGKKKGLVDKNGKRTRSGLFFNAIEIVGWARKHCGTRFFLFENVPGLLSNKKGTDFAIVLGQMAGAEFSVPPDGWQNAGIVFGNEGSTEWRILDSQYFGVPQRRRRVFALTDFGDWYNRPPILFERESLYGNTPASKTSRKNIAGTFGSRTTAGGGFGTDFELDGGLQSVEPHISHTLNARGGVGRIDAESETFIAAHTTGNGYWQEGFGPLRAREQDSHENLIAHSLRGEGFDASEDGTGRGIPLIALPLSTRVDRGGSHRENQGNNLIVSTLNANGKAAGSATQQDAESGMLIVDGKKEVFPIDLRNALRDPEKNDEQNRQGSGLGEDGEPSPTLSTLHVPGIAIVDEPIVFDPTQITSPDNRSNPKAGDPVHTLSRDMHAPVIAFDSKASGRNGFGVGKIAPTLRSMNASEGNQNAGGQIAIMIEALQPDWYHADKEVIDATSEERNTIEILRILQTKIGEKDFKEWSIGVFTSLQSSKILQPDLHGKDVRIETKQESEMVNGSLSCKKIDSGWTMYGLWGIGCKRHPPQGWELSEQFCRELGSYLSKLSQQGTQVERFLFCLWQSSERSGILRQTLSEIQEIRRSESDESKSTLPNSVRRLTPKETERLQYFPDNYTLIPIKKVKRMSKNRNYATINGELWLLMADGPRYRAIGNSMTTIPMYWIGKNIQHSVEVYG